MRIVIYYSGILFWHHTIPHHTKHLHKYITTNLNELTTIRPNKNRHIYAMCISYVVVKWDQTESRKTLDQECAIIYSKSVFCLCTRLNPLFYSGSLHLPIANFSCPMKLYPRMTSLGCSKYQLHVTIIRIFDIRLYNNREFLVFGYSNDAGSKEFVWRNCLSLTLCCQKAF